MHNTTWRTRASKILQLKHFINQEQKVTPSVFQSRYVLYYFYCECPSVGTFEIFGLVLYSMISIKHRNYHCFEDVKMLTLEMEGEQIAFH